jgi:hypothetical protein
MDCLVDFFSKSSIYDVALVDDKFFLYVDGKKCDSYELRDEGKIHYQLEGIGVTDYDKYFEIDHLKGKENEIKNDNPEYFI